MVIAMKKFFLLVVLCALGTTAQARNVDLATVPERATVQLTIYNAEDLTLVRETRRISFKKGTNPLQFSWANTLIDPTSVELRFLDHRSELEVLETTYPHDKSHMLYWQVQSEMDGEARIEINYFTAGISWTADYVALADAGEEHLHLSSFVRIANHSGEAYENAQVRLVVGVINLVEKVAHLAQGRTPIMPQETARYKMRAAKQAMMLEEMAAPAPMVAMDMMAGSAEMEAPKEIAKESLSEYFIYTIDGTETIPHGWAKRLRSFEADNVPVRVQYRYRPQEYGAQPVRLYLLRNDSESGLGLTPLPDGMIRIFRDNGRDGLRYVGEQTLKYVPIGDKIEINLGQDPEVIFELIPRQVWRDEIWLRVSGPELYRKVDGGVKIDVKSSVAGWDEHTLYSQRIRNYSAKAIEIEVRRSYDGDVQWRSSHPAVLHDYRTVEFTATVEAGASVDVYHEVTRREGYNQKKNNVELLSGKVN
jgi:hypothetical protein